MIRRVQGPTDFKFSWVQVGHTRREAVVSIGRCSMRQRDGQRVGGPERSHAARVGSGRRCRSSMSAFLSSSLYPSNSLYQSLDNNALQLDNADLESVYAPASKASSPFSAHPVDASIHSARPRKHLATSPPAAGARSVHFRPTQMRNDLFAVEEEEPLVPRGRLPRPRHHERTREGSDEEAEGSRAPPESL
jgi:hypothetical protein